MTSGLGRRSHQPESGRGNIPRNREIAGLRNLVAENADRAVLLADRAHQEIIQHQFRVVPADHGFVHGGFSFGEQSGQEQRALHLRTGDGKLVARAP